MHTPRETNRVTLRVNGRLQIFVDPNSNQSWRLISDFSLNDSAVLLHGISHLC